MKNNRQSILKQQQNLLEQLKNIGPFIAGSLGIVKRICGTKTCSCHTKGILHKAMYLTWKGDKQKNEMLYIPVSLHKDAALWSKNYKKLKLLIKKISDNQKKLIKIKR